MDTAFILRIILLFALLLLSGFFSGSETALFSLSHLQKRRIGTGHSGIDRSLRWLLGQPRRLIVTLLVGNELVNISVSTVVASLTHDVKPEFSGFSQVFLAMAVAVPLLLVFGEVTPKTVAIKIPEGWSRAVARPLRAFSFLITPLRLSVRTIADGIINVLGGKPPERERPLSEEEFISLVEVGSKGGELEPDEKDIIYNVFEFGDRTVAGVMTPMEDVFAISFSLPLPRIVKEVVGRQYSRIPVYKGRHGHIVGVLYAKDLVGFGQVLELSGKTLKELLRRPFFVPKTTKLSRLFREFQERRIHIAIVVDEYGEMMGVVTMEDLLGELFGELSEPEEVGSKGDSGHEEEQGADGDEGQHGGDFTAVTQGLPQTSSKEAIARSRKKRVSARAVETVQELAAQEAAFRGVPQSDPALREGRQEDDATDVESGDTFGKEEGEG